MTDLMAARVANLKRADVGRKGEYEIKLRSFNLLLNYLTSEKARVYKTPGKQGGLAFRDMVRKSEPFLWRANDIYFVMDGRKKVGCAEIYHQGIHTLLVRKIESRLEGFPLFHLFGEALASMAEYYFFLEVTSTFGLRKQCHSFVEKYKELLSLYYDKPKVIDDIVVEQIEEGVADPFAAYRQAATDMFEIWVELLDMANQRTGDETLDFHKVHSVFRRRKYGPLSSKYNYPNNILFVKSYCGKSTLEDKLLVKECFKILNESSSLAEFLQKIGIRKGSMKARKLSVNGKKNAVDRLTKQTWMRST